MLQDLVPKDKSDIERGKQCIALGYPAIAPIIPDLLEWMKDYNWPVAQDLTPFLASIGEPLLPEIERILDTTDEIWKYWILSLIVAESPQLAEQLRPRIERIAQHPTRDEQSEELHLKAQEILGNL